MEFKFDPRLEYQLEAIDSVVDVFDGHPNSHGEVPAVCGDGTTVANELLQDDGDVLANLNAVQEERGIAPSASLRSDEDGMLEFSVEMETGTGKTYVYLRTIHELFQQYGWKKFVVLVPSVAIREGVRKTLGQTASHFDNLYGRPPFNHCEYDSSALGDVIRFGTSNQIEVLVMTLQSINRGADNVMFHPHDALNGDRPVDRIGDTNPILVLDEPQNMEGERSRDAIRKLNPLFTLRYSATHRTRRNLVYRLTPVDAHELGLVKRIEVLSVTTDERFDRTYVKVLGVDADSSGPKAKLELHKNLKRGTKRGKKTVRAGASLYTASNGVDSYEDLHVTSIDADRNFVAFSDGTRLGVGETTDTDIETVQHHQIRETVREHFDKALERHEQGIKVLSLFFVDRVANFRGKSGEESGHLWEAFCETFDELKRRPEYEPLFGDLSPEDASGAYFAETTDGEIKTQNRSIREDVESYELIMRDKERLLSFDESTQFIFSHSALQEGWDNPNVFQICTLNNTVSRVKKRQEIGRGVRLPIEQDGTRLDTGDERNVLTVIANESYAEYAASLQEEYEAESYGDDDSATTRNYRERTTASPKREVVAADDDFEKLWSLIAPKTRYRTSVDSDELIQEVAERLEDVAVEETRLRLDRARLAVRDDAVTSRIRHNAVEAIDREGPVPDVVGELADETNLTRDTIARILLEADRFDALSATPHAFVSGAKDVIGAVKAEHVVEGIEYERTGERYATDVLTEIETYAEETISVEKSVYDEVRCDGDRERRFARRLDADDAVLRFLKLPPQYAIPTPYGDYAPDWAIVYRDPEWEDDERTGSGLPKRYLVLETTFEDPDDLPPRDRHKIRCASEHYDALQVDFEAVYDCNPEDAIRDVLDIDTT